MQIKKKFEYPESNKTKTKRFRFLVSLRILFLTNSEKSVHRSRINIWPILRIPADKEDFSYMQNK